MDKSIAWSSVSGYVLGTMSALVNNDQNVAFVFIMTGCTIIAVLINSGERRNNISPILETRMEDLMLSSLATSALAYVIAHFSIKAF